MAEDWGGGRDVQGREQDNGSGSSRDSDNYVEREARWGPILPAREEGGRGSEEGRRGREGGLSREEGTMSKGEEGRSREKEGRSREADGNRSQDEGGRRRGKGGIRGVGRLGTDVTAEFRDGRRTPY